MTTTPIDMHAVFHQRARRLAQATDRRDERRVLGAFAIVTVGRRVLGLPASWVRELSPLPPVSPLPQLPRWLPGLVVVRGQLLSLVDLGALYHIADTEPAVVAVVTGDRGDLGLLVDHVIGFRHLAAEDIASGSADPAADDSLPSLGTTRDLVTLLDVARLFDDERIVRAASQPGAAGLPIASESR